MEEEEVAELIARRAERKFEAIEEGVLGEFYYAIVKTSMGTLNGYIAVPPGHPWYGRDYNDIECEVHGGLTFSDSSYYGHRDRIQHFIEERDEAAASKGFEIGEHKFPSLALFADYYQRRLNAEIENDGTWKDYPVALHVDAWWVGFDCSHSNDINPGLEALDIQHGWPTLRFPGATYKDRDYVFHEIEGMVKQAIEAMNTVT